MHFFNTAASSKTRVKTLIWWDSYFPRMFLPGDPYVLRGWFQTGICKAAGCKGPWLGGSSVPGQGFGLRSFLLARQNKPSLDHGRVAVAG